jgi:hypothetical protein
MKRSLAILVLLGACGSQDAPPATPTTADITGPCHDLDSPDLEVRSAARDTLVPHLDTVQRGGTEQQMEAVGRLCEERVGIRPAWLR